MFERKLAIICLILCLSLCDPTCMVKNPIDCGFSGISKAMCEERGCCFKDGAAPSCYYPNKGMANITKVHIVHGCHFDAGFVDTTINIINRYFDEIYPRIYTEAVTYEKEGSEVQMKFTTQAWLISLFYDCPTNLGIHCPSEDALKKMNECIKKDWITWHAFPFVSQMELMDASSITFGINLSNDLKKRFNKKESHFISQNDVPSATASIIPILKKNNVFALRQGVNPVSQPVNVPNIYRWVDPASKESIVNMNHRGGYGGWENYSDYVIIPGYEEVLLVAFNGDNQGSYQPGWLQKIFEAAHSHFSQAQVIASTFDDFFDAAYAYLESNYDAIPELCREFGDTWIYGAASDPKKLASMRAVNRIRTKCEQQKTCDVDKRDYFEFSRLFLFNSEHSWGADTKMFLHDDENWSNDLFEECIRKKQANYVATINTWKEQREIGITKAVERIKNHTIAADIKHELDALTPTLPNLTDYSLLKDPELIELGEFVVSISTVTGAINYLYDNYTDRVWCDANHTIGVLQYTVYNKTDYDNFMKEYLISTTEWAPRDFGKPGLEKYSNRSSSIYGTYQNCYMKETEGDTTLLVVIAFDDMYHTQYGAPSLAYLEIRYDANVRDITLNTIIVNKTATRMPEAFFLQFNLLQDEADQQYSGWEMDKLGQWYTLNTLDMTMLRGNAHQHGILSGFRYVYKKHSLFVESLDAGILVSGEATGFPCPFNRPDLSRGVSMMMSNNLWGVNYIMWYPFEKKDSNMIFRYILHFNE